MAYENRIVINFGAGKVAIGVRVSQEANPAWVTRTLGFYDPMPVIFISGGAGLMSPEAESFTLPLIEDGLVRYAEERGVAIIDGGTSSGVMRLIGQARAKRGYKFPLIGIAPYQLVTYPGYLNMNAMAELDSGHSHFVLTSGSKFGDESGMIFKLAMEMSGSGKKPWISMVVNGGEITRREVFQRSAAMGVVPSFPLLVMEGSGRFADELADAVQTGHTSDPMVDTIARQNKISIIAIDDGPERLRTKLEDLLFRARRPRA